MNRRNDPIERKVQLTGGSTYTVSLPKEWAGTHEIEPGSRVNLYSRGEQLIVTRKASREEQTEHVTTIEAGERDPATVAQSVAAAYVAGCDEIQIEEIETTRQRRAVVEMIRGFVGLEVMSESDSEMVARTMLDAGTLSPEQALAQIERTTLEMHEEAIAAVIAAEGDVGEQITRQDDDVDRLFALIARGFQQSLADPAVTMGEDSLTPFEYYMTARQLERIADHAGKIAATAARLDTRPPTSTAQDLVALGERSRTVLREAVAGLLDTDSQQHVLGTDEAADLDTVIADAEQLLTDIEVTDQQLYEANLADGYLIGLVLDSIKRTVQYAVNIAESGVQAAHRRETML